MKKKKTTTYISKVLTILLAAMVLFNSASVLNVRAEDDVNVEENNVNEVLDGESQEENDNEIQEVSNNENDLGYVNDLTDVDDLNEVDEQPVDTNVGDDVDVVNEDDNVSEDKKEDNQKSAKSVPQLRNENNNENGTPTDSDPYFNIYWVEATSGQVIHRDPVTGKVIEVKQTPTEDKPAIAEDKPYVEAQIEFNIGRSSVPIEEGEIKVVLPRSLFTQWDFNGDGYSADETRDLKVGVKKKPAKGDDDFWYYFASKDENGKYVEDDNGEFLVISNFVKYNVYQDAPKTFICTISYPYIPSRVNGDMVHELKAEYIVETPGYTPTSYNDTLKVQIDTSAKIDSFNKKFNTYTKQGTTVFHYTDKWNNKWGEFSETGLDQNVEYVYVPMILHATVVSEDGGKATRPFVMQITKEEVGALLEDEKDGMNKGQVIAIGPWRYDSSGGAENTQRLESNMTEYRILTTDEYPKGYFYGSNAYTSLNGIPENIANESITYSSQGLVDVSTSVLVAYPKDYFQLTKDYAENPDYANAYLTNKAEVTLSEIGDGDTSYKESEVASRDQYVNFKYYTGLFGLSKYHLASTLGRNFYPKNPSTATPAPKDSPEKKLQETKQSNKGQWAIQGEDEQDNSTTGGSDMTKESSYIMGGKDELLEDKEVVLLTYYLGDSKNQTRLWQFTVDNPAEVNYNELVNGHDYGVVDPNEFGKNDYILEIMDDLVFLDNHQLVPGRDYELVKTLYVATDEKVYDPYQMEIVSLEKYNELYAEDPDFVPLEETKPDVYVRSEHTGEWKLAKSQLEKNEILEFDSGVGEVKYEFRSNRPTLCPDIYLVIKLLPSEQVKGYLKENDGDIQVVNVESVGVRTEDGRQLFKFGEETVEGQSESVNIVKQWDTTGLHGDIVDGERTNLNNQYLYHERTYQYLSSFDTETKFTKELINNSKESWDDAENLISRRYYTLRSDHNMITLTDDPDAMLKTLAEHGIETGQKEIVFYDLIPAGGSLDTDSLRASYIKLGRYPNEIEGDLSYELIHDYKKSGQTLLVAKVSYPEGEDDSWLYIYNEETNTLNLSSIVRLYFGVYYDWEEVSLVAQDNKYEAINYASVYVPTSDDGYPDNPKDTTGGRKKAYPDDRINDIFEDLNPDGVDEGDSYYYDSVSTTFNIASASITGYSKHVRSESEPTYRINSAVKPDGSYSYRLRYGIDEGTKAKNIIIYDVLEYAFVDEAYLVDDFKDKYDLTERYWLGTFDQVDISKARELGADVKVYYSTSDRLILQEGLDTFTGGSDQPNEYADLSNETYWTATTVDELNNLSKDEKKQITALAFDCTKDQDDNEFILERNSEKTGVLQIYIHMIAPDAEEVEKGWDDKGSYVDPNFVYAYNNSFINYNITNSSGEWTTNGVRMSDGTTVRIAEPEPDIYKKVEDSDESAGATSDSDMTDEDTVHLTDRSEVFKYTITTKVPVFGGDITGNDVINTYSIIDDLVSELEFVSQQNTKITIGEVDADDSFFGYDPEGGYNGHKGYFRRDTGEQDESTGKRIFEDIYFESLEQLPDGFIFRIPGLNNTYYGTRLEFTLDYERDIETKEPVEGGYDRVREFVSENVTIEFYARIKAGATLGAYEDERVPNTTYYKIPNHSDVYSNTVYIQPDEDTPNPKKEVGLVNENGEETGLSDHQVLDSLDQEIIYVIDATIPYNHKSLSLSDTVEPILQIDPDSVEIIFSGTVDVNVIEISEEPSLDINGNPMYDYSYLPTELVEKDENGKPTNLPQKINRIVTGVTDDDGVVVRTTREINKTFTLEELNKAIKALYIYDLNVSLEGNDISLTMGEKFINGYGDYLLETGTETIEYTDSRGNEKEFYRKLFGDYGPSGGNSAVNDYGLAGLNVSIKFKAKIIDGADLEPYKVDGKTLIPNVAEYIFGDNPAMETEPATVTPPDVTKTVNDTVHYDLGRWDEVFEYKIATLIPQASEGEEITSVIFSDTLEDVLEFTANDETVFIVGEEKEDASEVKRSGQKLTIDLTKYVETNPGSVVIIKFKAKIKNGLTIDDLKDYIVEEKAEVPNEAVVKIKFDNGVEKELKSKPVTITPPDTPDLEKEVNSKPDYVKLQKTDEKFTYTLSTVVPNKAEIIVITDTLESVLEFVGDVKVIVGGKTIENAAKIKDQTLTVTIESADLKDMTGKDVIVEFDAKVKANANLSKFIKNGIPTVPNTAEMQFNNNKTVYSNTVEVKVPEKPNNGYYRYYIPKTGD